MADSILVWGLRMPTLVGVDEWERRVQQELVVNLRMQCDCRVAAGSDELDDALDYAAVSQLLLRRGEVGEYRLIEALAEDLAESVLEKFPQIQSLWLQLQKPGAVPEAEWVGIEIERKRD